MFRWNKPYTLIMKIKKDYTEKFGLDTLDFKTWLVKLNKSEYNDVFGCLQTNQHEEFLLIRYGIADMQESMWTDIDSIYRECRSLVVDLKEDKIVLLNFRKFFNLNEAENDIESVMKEIEGAEIVEFANKLDGSMQSVRYYKNDYFMAGSMALDLNKSWRLQDGYSMLTDNHKQMIKNNPIFTFIFEYISVRDAHVVIYEKDKEGLYLIGMRNADTGEELNYAELRKFARKYGVLMANI